MAALPSASVLVRTWFGDDAAWESLLVAVASPSEDGFSASVIAVNDPVFDGLSADALKEKQTSGPFVSFLADETTLTNAEYPIMAVWVFHGRDDDQRDHRPFRVVPSALWSVENNINLANMDWAEFASSVDQDGVFRGF